MKKDPVMIKAAFYWLFPLMLLYCGSGRAQSEPFQWPADVMEDMNWTAGAEEGFRMIVEEQEDLRSRPVDLNSAGEEDLAGIPFLNVIQRKYLLDYLKAYGEMFSIYELLVVRGFDSALIRRISPFITFRPASQQIPMTLKNLCKYGKNELILQAGSSFPRSRGYRVPETLRETSGANYYPGNPYGISFRYTWSFSDRLSTGLSGDKDPGEQFFEGGQKYGMDYYSGFICYSPQRFLRRVIIGNYRAGWGLGLTFNTGSSFGISPGFSTDSTATGGIRPTQSLSQGNILRGMALSLGAGHLTLSGIFSYRKRDANVTGQDTVTGGATVFSSFIETGYHRTAAEISKRGRASELILGGNLNFRGNFFSLGVTAYSTSLSASFEPPATLYNHFTFRGRSNFVSGADINLFYRFIRVTGELSRSGNGGIAWIAGLNLNPDPRFSAVIFYRNYQPGYQNLYSGCFRQSTYCSNEKAWFFNLALSLPKRFSLNLFADFCSFPWVKFSVSKPSSGNDAGMLLSWQANNYLNLTLRYMYSAVETNTVKDGDVVHGTGTERSDDLRFQMNWSVSQAVNMQSRVELKKFKQGSIPETTGWLLFQDICWKPLKLPLKIVFRYSVFDCPDYNARIWAYEPDVLYGYSMPACYGRGIRACSLIRYDAGRHVTFSLKAGITRYNDKNIISSGLDQIDANWKLDLSLQCRIRI